MRSNKISETENNTLSTSSLCQQDYDIQGSYSFWQIKTQDFPRVFAGPNLIYDKINKIW